MWFLREHSAPPEACSAVSRGHSRRVRDPACYDGGVPRVDALAGLCGRYGVDALYAFGSRAAEAAARLQGACPPDSSPSSDLDLGVLPRPGTQLDAEGRARLTADLEAFFGVTRVDLVVLPEAPPFLALDVISGELLYAGDRDRVARYELEVLRRAGDLAPFERERRRTILAGARG